MTILTTTAAIHAAIVSQIDTDIPSLQTVSAYEVFSDSITLPAVLVEMVSAGPGADNAEPHTLSSVWAARCIVDSTLADAYMQARALAIEVALSVVDAGCFGRSEIGYSQLASIGPGAIQPELDAYRMWVVQWTHEIFIDEYTA